FAGQHETRLIPEDEDFIDPDEGASRVLAEFEYGLRPGFSVATSYAHLPINGEQRDQISLGLRGQYRGVFARLDTAKDADDGDAWELALLTKLGPADISLSHARFNDLLSERTLRQGAGLQSLSNLRLGLPLTWAGRSFLYNSFTAEYAEFEDNREWLELSHRASFRLWRVAVSHKLDYRKLEDGLSNSATTNGSLRLSGRVGRRHYLQLNSNYQLRPQRKLLGISISSNTRLNEHWNLRLDASRSYGDTEENRFMAGISHRGRRATWGLGAGYSDRNGALFNANLSFSFGRNPANSGWLLDSRSLARTGLIHARSYVDQNNNGQHDPHEPGVAEAEFLSRGDGQQTDANGHITLNGYGSYQPAPLRLDETSLQDPFWIATHEGYNVVTRPGRVTTVDYSVVPTGEVDGMVYLIDGDESQAVANVLLLLTAEGQRYSTRSTYDGFFLFERIPPGRYLLSIDNTQLTGKGLSASAPIEVVIKEAGDVGGNHNMHISRMRNELLARIPNEASIQ
ncbi:MAG: carboxypeptidase-like regulatory domain-containing protein, partial [Salinisphaeraceae bacterium]|nr:carboxypeptidase-like regulatory domain-containing protein [Salinisphaeraceae bacterium]